MSWIKEDCPQAGQSWGLIRRMSNAADMTPWSILVARNDDADR
jgi:hypothetical protein